MQRYMVISSDCHAGLPNAQYRDWLDPKYHAAFDAARALLAEFAAETSRPRVAIDVDPVGML